MKDITFLNIIHNEKLLFSSPFSCEVGNLAENVRLEGLEKQAILSCRWHEKQATSLLQRAKEIGNKSAVACLITKHDS